MNNIHVYIHSTTKWTYNSLISSIFFLHYHEGHDVKKKEWEKNEEFCKKKHEMINCLCICGLNGPHWLTCTNIVFKVYNVVATKRKNML